MSIARSLTLLVLIAAAVVAQQTTGTISGTVRDSSGAVVAGAAVEVQNQETKLVLRAASGDDGTFVLNNVPPGPYTLSVKQGGFKTFELRELNVQVVRNAVIDARLEPGAVSERIEVTAAAEAIDTQTSVMRTNFASKMILDLPSSSRNPLVAGEMTPGVEVNNGALTGGSQMLSRDGVSASVSGNRQQHNSFYLDGSDNSGGFRNLGLQMPNVEAISEVQVITSSNSAEYGKQPGGYFNVITKSGTNDFRGGAYYFGQATALNANTWVRNRNGLDRVPAKQKQFGVLAGGPVILPKLYSGRDRTFFFANWQQYRDQRVSTNQNVRFPTASMYDGDFSQFRGQLYDPTNNQPLAGNRIPASLIDPVAQKLVKEMIPTVGNLGDTLVWEFPAEPLSNEYLTKIDHNLTAMQRLNFSVFQVYGSNQTQNSSVPRYYPALDSSDQITTSARHTWTMSANRVLESNFSLTRHEVNRGVTAELVGRDLSDFGANWPQVVEGGTKYLPGMSVRDGFTASQPGSAGNFVQSNMRFASTLAWVKGAHNLRFGFETQRSSVESFNDFDGTNFSFQGRLSNRNRTAVTNYAPNAVFTHSVADLIMGRYENMGSGGINQYSIPAWSNYFFVQDQWRVSRRLTLNYGLRYEFYPPPLEKDGRSASFSDQHQSSRFPNAPRGLAFQGDDRIPAAFIYSDRNNWGPRLGAAYDVFGNGKLALRAGYGLYYSFPSLQVRVYSASQFPYNVRITVNEGRVRDPWLTSVAPVFTRPPTPLPRDANEFIRTYTFPSPTNPIAGFDPNMRTPQVHQWNTGAEYEVVKSVIVSASWVGARGVDLIQMIPFNYARYRNTPAGEAPSLNINNIIARTLYPTLSRFSVRAETAASSWYDAFQLGVNVRRGGLSTRLAYTHASSFGDGGGVPANGGGDEDPTGFTSGTNNPMNPRGEKGRSARIDTFRVFYTYDLPFLKGAQSAAAKLLGNWQLSGLTQYLSGSPFDVVLGVDANFDGISNTPQDRPDLIAPIRYTEGSADAKMSRYFDPASFRAPVISANNLFGNLQRNSLVGPGALTTNLAAVKNFRLTERMSVQVRMEAYNLFNHPLLGDPIGNMASADFTRVLQKNGNRTMQYGLKFYW
ncbi:MAG: TonB-dependent receptor [Bryobacteraceae bacterium]|nr:TonB-dependent receptor [Bryobacteraceae bacterium]